MNFDDIMSSIRSAADTVSKKTEETVEISKLKFNIAKIKGDIEKKYADLGRCVYGACKGAENYQESSNAIVKDIDDLKAELKKAEDELKEITGTFTCPQCGKKCGKGDSFCSGCGRKTDL